MKIVIIGGHLAPALSVLEALPKATQVLFIGRKYALEGDNALSLEYKTITALCIPFVGLNTGRLQRKITRFTLFSLLKLPFGIIKSFLILIDFRPDVVMGFGGYVSIPVIFCASVLRIPVVIHEQTMGGGFANKIVSRFAKKICISWDSSREYFPKDKVILTGNPMRKFPVMNSAVEGQCSIFKNKLPTIYVTGGSSGSHSINVLIEEVFRELLGKYNIIHQVGNAHEYNDFDRLKQLRESLPARLRDNYILEKFIDPSQVGDLLKLSSLVISRSGMNIVTELIHFEKPALLIPLPFSQNGEQQRNAEFLKKIGLGIVLSQSKLNGKKLLQSIRLMFRNIDNYKINRESLGNLPGKNAAQNIISVINYVYKSKTAKTF
ncbi:MAG: UDP-N-acetylglucosamine--N-acetylmuramyl-(pentapeptide) pyrophosphoryl-undecaprenol N-acetylglucosamine transferase [Candidatus Levybacteria bacterium]|nr:UDP-N-acetylglucosamine--N-acetylmuramyl-(pentapeptide) pyrophosphoryl-undecaprenol N-acetylglucosamine transferase [Candidatus Levybacteria bacterium]